MYVIELRLRGLNEIIVEASALELRGQSLVTSIAYLIAREMKHLLGVPAVTGVME